MSETIENPTGAQIQSVDFGMPATERCDRCGAQAFVEVEVYDMLDRKKRRLDFCAHHYGEHEAALMVQAVRIIDHRPALMAKKETVTT